MCIKINLHKTHRSYADGLEAVETEGNTVGDCLDDLIVQYPGMKDKLFDAKGRLLNTIEIYLNMESTYPDELKKVVKPGDEIHLTILLAGG
jgi:molybdopterin converting factor small subunit